MVDFQLVVATATRARSTASFCALSRPPPPPPPALPPPLPTPSNACFRSPPVLAPPTNNRRRPRGGPGTLTDDLCASPTSQRHSRARSNRALRALALGMRARVDDLRRYLRDTRPHATPPPKPLAQSTPGQASTHTGRGPSHDVRSSTRPTQAPPPPAPSPGDAAAAAAALTCFFLAPSPAISRTPASPRRRLLEGTGWPERLAGEGRSVACPPPPPPPLNPFSCRA